MSKLADFVKEVVEETGEATTLSCFGFRHSLNEYTYMVNITSALSDDAISRLVKKFPNHVRFENGQIKIWRSEP